MNREKLLYLFTFICIFGIKVSAQENQILLTEYFRQLEKRFAYSFSYADKAVEDKKILIPPPSLSFKEHLDFIENHTNLKFKILPNKIVAVKEQLFLSSLNKIQELEEVVLINYLTEGITKKTNGTFVIDYDNFGMLPGIIEPDILLTIQALPGIESTNETTSQINVRGGTQDQNLILWDNIRVYHSGHFFGLISAINPYQTNKVTVIKNGTNIAFGNSVSSVVAMETETVVNKDFSGEIGLNLLNAHAFLDIPLTEKSSIQFSSRTSINNFLETYTFQQYYGRAFQDTEATENSEEFISNNEHFGFHDINMRYLFKPSRNEKLNVNFFQFHNNLIFSENPLDDPAEHDRSKLEQNSFGGGMTYKRKWSDDFSTAMNVYISSYKLYSENADLVNNLHLTQENVVLEGGLKLNSTLKLNQNLYFQNGYELLNTDILNSEVIINPFYEHYEKDNVLSHSYFSGILFKSKDSQSILEVGGRFNYFDKFDLLLVEPRLSFNQRFLNFFTLEILGEYKSQATTQIIDLESDFLGVEKERWQLANEENIPLLKSKQASLGLHYFHNDWLITAEVYLKEVKGIHSKSQGFQNQYELVEISGSYKAAGLDFLISKRIGHFNAWASYSLNDNTYTFPDLDDQQNFPNNTEIENSLSFATSYAFDNFKVSAGLKWRSGKPFTAITDAGLLTNTLLYEKANSSNLPYYMRLDVSASKEVVLYKNIKAKIGASIWNLLDHNNIINAYYEKDDNEINLIAQSGLGITPNFLFTIIF